MDVIEVKPLIDKAWAIMKWIAEQYDAVDISHEEPNPYYGYAAPGCLTLAAYYGAPISIGTPIGGWRFCSGVSIGKPEVFLDTRIIHDRLGLVPIYHSGFYPDGTVRAVYEEGIGEYGPVWAITRDLAGEPMPEAIGEFRHEAFAPGMRPTIDRNTAKAHFAQCHPLDFISDQDAS